MRLRGVNTEVAVPVNVTATVALPVVPGAHAGNEGNGS